MPRRLKMTVVCFHFLAVLSVICIVPITLAIGSEGTGAPKFVLLSVPWVCVLFALVVELVAWGLKRRQYQAWVSGIVISGLAIIFHFLSMGIGGILGGLALWGLIDSETVAAFRPVPPNTTQPPTNS